MRDNTRKSVIGIICKIIWRHLDFVVVVDHKEDKSSDTGRFECVFKDSPMSGNFRCVDNKLYLKGMRIKRAIWEKFSEIDKKAAKQEAERLKKEKQKQEKKRQKQEQERVLEDEMRKKEEQGKDEPENELESDSEEEEEDREEKEEDGVAKSSDLCEHKLSAECSNNNSKDNENINNSNSCNTSKPRKEQKHVKFKWIYNL